MGIGWVATRDYALCPTATMAEITTLHARLDLGGVTGASPPALDRPWTAAGGYGRHRVAIGWVSGRCTYPTPVFFFPGLDLGFFFNSQVGEILQPGIFFEPGIFF